MPALICDTLHDPAVIAKLTRRRKQEYARVRAIAIEHSRKAEEAEAQLRHSRAVVHAAELRLRDVYNGG